jgi:hypothetical protein
MFKAVIPILTLSPVRITDADKYVYVTFAEHLPDGAIKTLFYCSLICALGIRLTKPE